MRTPRALLIGWYDFDRHTPTEREAMRNEIEEFMAEMDIQSCNAVLDEEHPNTDYEFQPIIALKGNYRR